MVKEWAKGNALSLLTDSTSMQVTALTVGIVIAATIGMLAARSALSNKRRQR